MSKHRLMQVAFSSLGIIVVLAIIYALLRRPEPSSPPRVITLQPRPTPEPPTPTPATTTIYVSGAVKQPDVYTRPLNSNVKDAITAASGPTDDADLEQINLASRLSDQMQVDVPYKGEAAVPPSEGSTPGTATGKININTASVEELDKLPSIGPAMAQAIIDYRTKNGAFKTIEAIKEVPRIKDALFEKIKDQITVGP